MNQENQPKPLSDAEVNIRIEQVVFGDDLMPDGVLDRVDARHAAHDALGIDYGRRVPEDKQVEWDALVKNWRRPARPFSQDTSKGREAMWLLIEYLRTNKSKGKYFQSTLDVYDDGSARVNFSIGGVHFYANAKTLPRAVADAALAICNNE